MIDFFHQCSITIKKKSGAGGRKPRGWRLEAGGRRIHRDRRDKKNSFLIFGN